MLVTCEYIPTSFTSSIEVEVPSEAVQQKAALKAFKRAVRTACRQKFELYGVPVAEKRFVVDVPNVSSLALLAQPIRVTGTSNKVRARSILRSIPAYFEVVP